MKKSFYKKQKVAYWTIFTNIILVLVTFWLGLVVQDMVASKNANVSGVLARVEYINCVKPSIDSLNVNYIPLIRTIVKDSTILTEDNQNNIHIHSIAKDRLVKKADSLLLYYDCLINTTRTVMYYFDESDLNINVDTSLISRIGLLFDYKELIDYCQHDESYLLQKNNFFETISESFYENRYNERLNRLYDSPGYICLMGANINHKPSSNHHRKVFKDLYKDLRNHKDSTEASIFFESITLALDIHNILNKKLILKQPETDFINIISKSPWPILLFSIFITCLVFNICLFSTKGKKEENPVQNCDNTIGDASLLNLIVLHIEKLGSANFAEIVDLLNDKLPENLTDEQKKNKIIYLLLELIINKKIKSNGEKEWVLTE